MKKNIVPFVLGVAALFFTATNASAHCEIPCGIYDDGMRFEMIFEHITTIEKSMNQIMALEKKEHHNSNQLIRWVTNKEQHADKLQEIVSQYFLTQRIKPSASKYNDKLAVLHQMLIAAMKCKQTTDLGHVKKLRELNSKFKALYLAGK
ncbi:MAG: superoxide dismutase [Ni] [Thermodesulfobacteriota bacterium]